MSTTTQVSEPSAKCPSYCTAQVKVTTTLYLKPFSVKLLVLTICDDIDSVYTVSVYTVCYEISVTTCISVSRQSKPYSHTLDMLHVLCKIAHVLLSLTGVALFHESLLTYLLFMIFRSSYLHFKQGH